MQLSRLLIAVFAAVAAAQSTLGPNAFNVPKSGNWLLKAGEPTTFNWSNKQGSTVTIRLRSGSNGDLAEGTVVANSIPNSGTFTYTPPKNIVEGASYTLEIVDDQDPSKINYTQQFVIQSDNKASSTATTSGSSASASASSSSAASSSASAASSSSASAASSSASASASSASASASQSSASASASASGTSQAASAASSAASTAVPTSNAAVAVRAGGSLVAVAAAFAYAL